MRAWFGWVALVGIVTVVLSGCDQGLTTTVTSAKTDPGSKPLPTEDNLRERLDWAVDYTLNARRLDADTSAAWQVVHGILAYGRDFQIRVKGELVPALDYLLGGGTLNGWNLRKGDHGLEAVLEAGSKTGQGHEDQWLGYLSQCGMQPSDKIVVGGADYTVQDLITQAQWDIYQGMEATWTLMAMSTYLPLDATWKSKDGTEWNIERIVAMESCPAIDDANWNRYIGGSPCGASHRLYGLAMALNRHKAQGGKRTESWTRAEKTVQRGIDLARQYQQPDGSFSTHFFERPGTSSDVELRINRTGHILEFLAVAMNDEQLSEPWVTRAAESLIKMLELTRDLPLECGSLYHAAHGLKIYRERRFGPRSAAATASRSGAPESKPSSTANTDSP